MEQPEKFAEQKRVDETVKKITIERERLLSSLKKTTAQLNEVLRENGQLNVGGDSFDEIVESNISLREQEQRLQIKDFQRSKEEKRAFVLHQMADSPYFGRIDVWDKELEENFSVYLGLSSFAESGQHIVYDWRAPIASLYYEGKLGDNSYQTMDGAVAVNVQLKRQFIIKQAVIETMADTTEVIGDEVLLKVLESNSDSHMKSIVSTIQQEQNAIIRDEKSPVLFVQGVAGSGKTSAIMQRMAYVLYTHRHHLSSKDILMYSPNHLFSEYISQVLPSLGEEDIQRLEFYQFLKPYLPEFTIQRERKSNAITAFKESLSFYKLFEDYVQSLAEKGLQFFPYRLNEETILSKKDLRNLFKKTNKELPLHGQILELQHKLLQKIKRLKEKEKRSESIEKEIETMALDVLQEMEGNGKLLDEENGDTIRAELAQHLVDKHYAKAEKRTQQLGFLNIKLQYLHFLTVVPQLINLAEWGIEVQEWEEHLEQVHHELKQKNIQLCDGVAYYALKRNMLNDDHHTAYRYIFIDEVQDYTSAQVALIHDMYPRAKYTLSGDLNQLIYGNTSVVDNIHQLFPEQVTDVYLKTSYRSSREITQFANHILKDASGIEAYGRSGARPAIGQYKNQSEIFQALLSDIRQHPKEEKKAIICKNQEECQQVYQALHTETAIEWIQKDKGRLDRDLVLLPVSLAKGLEFDAVYCLDANQDQYHTDEDRNILYTICTRAMHRLTILATNELSSFFSSIPAEQLQMLNK
ncbi:RNA polymerase recycling motor HelD [Pisciglobus halotolerans]|uniref:DNA helicase-2 / ATP-dependent DNA helicase PcrA n=1 Tax=Pisciglobus halotolerans TaxID=745365 RepID=A0A1I3C1G6_9LACT|nr:RNA polymerase recycling motor HelD [Pisciglobus halotolerans]SFH68332.1 DNA helicase-2 / ATP-dependent DNA helicase PcrA [Pisciglobus halotolerans]